jgi:hypothetical protein
MHPLDYQTRPRGTSSKPIALFVLPVAATAITFVSVLHNASQEPFGDFHIYDAAIQVGSPFVALVLWGYWCLRAVPKRLSITVVLPLLAWAAVLLALSFLLAIAYFSEPWNE